MKTKILMSVLAIGMAIALIGGATMAWFTAEAEVPEQQFTAGTVVVNVDDEVDIQTPEGKYFDNVNPGDCATVTWTIINEGTKAAQLRVKLEKLWEGWLDADNVYYAPAPDSGWVMYEEEDELWLYYVGDIENGVPGTYNPDGGNTEPKEVVLPLVVGFDGEDTTDFYQGKWFKLNGEVFAVQASNGAPSAVWEDAWDVVTSDSYSDESLKDYFINGPGKDMPCWDGDDEPGEPDKFLVSANIVEVDGGSVTGTGSYEKGAAVELVAVAGDGFVFTGWDYEGLLDAVEAGDMLTFTMPDYDVTVTANFEEVEEPVTEYTVSVNVVFNGHLQPGTVAGTIEGEGDYAPGETVNLTAVPGTYQWGWGTKSYKFWKWTGHGPINNSNDVTISFEMPESDVNIIAHFK